MDFDLRNYAKGGQFVKAADLRTSGPRRLVIEGVEEADGFPSRDGKPPKKELVLVFADQTKFQLTAAANKEAMADLYGYRTSGWIGKAVTLFCDPTVRNPSGVVVGGVRIMRPDTSDAADADFTSDLEETAPPPFKGNGAEQTRARTSRARS